MLCENDAISCDREATRFWRGRKVCRRCWRRFRNHGNGRSYRPWARRKEQLLVRHGFTYRADLHVFVNASRKTVFCAEAVDLCDVPWLELRLGETGGDDWTFHFLNEPSNATKEVLARVVD